jgi:hypothetical protein
MSLRNLILGYMLYFLFPLWLAAGVADYLCHRRTSIEHTSGLGESKLHLLLAIEIAIPLLAGLFLEINALVLIAMIAFVLMHSLTAWWDTVFTNPKRYISPFEQAVHSSLEYVPIIAVSLLVLLHWNQLIALFGLGPQAPSFELRLKVHPLPTAVVIIVLTGIFVAQGVLLFEEAWRCWRAQRCPAPAT